MDLLIPIQNTQDSLPAVEKSTFISQDNYSKDSCATIYPNPATDEVLDALIQELRAIY